MDEDRRRQAEIQLSGAQSSKIRGRVQAGSANNLPGEIGSPFTKTVMSTISGHHEVAFRLPFAGCSVVKISAKAAVRVR
jgi:hypothetical protein